MSDILEPEDPRAGKMKPMDDDFEALLAAGAAADVSGWDFGWLDEAAAATGSARCTTASRPTGPSSPAPRAT
jgi:hypothetical protein